MGPLLEFEFSNFSPFFVFTPFFLQGSFGRKTVTLEFLSRFPIGILKRIWIFEIFGDPLSAKISGTRLMISGETQMIGNLPSTEQ